MPVDVVRDDLNIKDLVITPNESKYFDPRDDKSYNLVKWST